MSKKLAYKLIAISMAAGTLLTQLPTTVLAATAPEAEAEQKLSGETPSLDDTVDVPDDIITEPEHPDTEDDAENIGSSTLTYDEVFRVPNSAITSITNNAKHYGGSVIGRAIDDNPGTHWETNKPNSDTFHNAVTVAFDDSYEIAAVRYLVRQDGARPKGFPLEYNLYYSTTDSGEDFQLLKHGVFSSTFGDTVSIEFQPTEMRRFRFEFVKAQNNWASMAELSFYKEDALEKTVNDIFANGTHTALKSEYQDKAKLEELVEQAQSHPNKNLMMLRLQDALTLLDNPNAFEATTFTALQRGNTTTEKNRTHINTVSQTFLNTGYYITPGETVYVYVDADADSILPSVVLGQFGNMKGGMFRWYQLKPGMNKITAPDYDNMHCAAIYINNAALPSQQPYAPQIRIEGGTKYPMYVHGKTSTAEFKAELEEYLKTVSYNEEDFANGNPNNYHYNIAEYTSENVSLTTSAAGAMKAVNQLVSKGSSVEEKMDGWEFLYDEYARYSGFEMEDESSPDYRPRNKFMSRVTVNGPFAYAATGYTGFNGGNSLKKDDSFYVSILSASMTGGWGVTHEWGHMFDSHLLGRPESTNNLYSLHFQDIYNDANRMVKENRWENHFTAYHNTKEYPNDQLFYGAITYQLQAIYGEDIYGRAQRISRLNENGCMDGLTNNNDRLAVAVSLAAGVDLTQHYEYYQQKVSDAAKAKVAHLPKETHKTWYVNNKSFAEDAQAFTQADAQPTIQASGTDQILLTLSMEEPDNSILCYEIYRDGEFLGVTYGSSFTDKTAQANTNYTYTAIAYDRKLNPSLESEAVVKNPSEPILSTTRGTVFTLREAFDPMTIIQAKDALGNDITDRIELVENNVNTEQKGTYSVTYRVADELGNQTTLTLPIRVVSQTIYLGDQTWSSAEISWGSIRKDKSVSQKTLSLLTQSGENTFAKGLGTHANSTITYDLTKTGADIFEAYVGVDGAMRNSKASSLTFEVYVDGEKKFDSGLMKSNTPAKLVSVDVKDAQELKLVVTDGGNGNGSDHADWADAKLLVDSSKPTISGIQNYTFDLGGAPANLDLLEGLTAADVEDGDLTDSIQVSTDFDPDQAGVYEVTYTVTDSDGNTTTETGSIAVVNAAVYATDVAWKQANAGWGSVHKDKSVSNNAIQVRKEDGAWATYEKGIGTHAASTIVYDLTDKEDLYAFTSYVGVDGAMKNTGVSSVNFEVYVDGVKKFDSGLMKSNTPAKFVNVPINGAKELKLVVTAGGNGNGSDHADWADAKFWTVRDKSTLADLLEEAGTKEAVDYTEDSFADLQDSIAAAQAVLDNETASQDEIDLAAADLRDALDQLVSLLDTSELESYLEFAKQADSISYVSPEIKYQPEARLKSLQAVGQEAQDILDGNTEATQEEIDKIVWMLNYYLEEMGQTYEKGGSPVAFVDTRDLQFHLDFAGRVKNLSYVDPALNHREERLSNLKAYVKDAEKVLKDTDATQEAVDQAVAALECFLEDIGQTYEEYGKPVIF